MLLLIVSDTIRYKTNYVLVYVAGSCSRSAPAAESHGYLMEFGVIASRIQGT